MSSFPTFSPPIGLGWNFTKTPKFSNIVQVPQSGRHPANATLQQGVIYDMEIIFNYLKNARAQVVGNPVNDQRYVQEFFESMGGGNQWFLFDPSTVNLDSVSVVQDTTQLSNGWFGVGDGVTTVFPLWRSSFATGILTHVERIQNVTGLTGIYDNGVLTVSSYTQSNFPATVTFGSAPAAGHLLSWAGTYNYLVQFAEDSLDFNEFLFQLWSLKSMKMTTINL